MSENKKIKTTNPLLNTSVEFYTRSFFKGLATFWLGNIIIVFK